MPRIDLNSDVGEGFAHDAAIIEVVTSANIACGAHAGDPELMSHTVALAIAHGVAIGAHTSYPDREGFGRRDMDLPSEALTACVAEQIATLAEICEHAGTRLAYVKPHGALYNRIATDRVQARAVVAAIAGGGAELPLLTLPGSIAMAVAADAGVRAVSEGYADRAYTAAAALVPRSQAGAVIKDERLVAARAVGLARGEPITTIDAAQVRIAPRSICVHGDTPGAARMSARIREALARADVEIVAFA